MDSCPPPSSFVDDGQPSRESDNGVGGSSTVVLQHTGVSIVRSFIVECVNHSLACTRLDGVASDRAIATPVRHFIRKRTTSRAFVVTDVDGKCCFRNGLHGPFT